MERLDTTQPTAGNPGNWPTAGAINNRIEMSERANSRTSPLHGLGEAFIRFGNEFGINPGFVCALLQRESQLASDGSILPTRCNNFGGNTWGSGSKYPKCAAASGIAGREWKQMPNPETGLRAVFENLNESQYRSTGGRAEDVIEVYAPAFENNHDEIFLTFASVGSNLGITITRDTNIYTNAGTVSGPSSGGSGAGISKGIADWLVSGIVNSFYRVALVSIGLVILFVAVRRLLT
jgi:hypothetical protein